MLKIRLLVVPVAFNREFEMCFWGKDPFEVDLLHCTMSAEAETECVSKLVKGFSGSTIGQ